MTDSPTDISILLAGTRVAMTSKGVVQCDACNQGLMGQGNPGPDDSHALSSGGKDELPRETQRLKSMTATGTPKPSPVSPSNEQGTESEGTLETCRNTHFLDQAYTERDEGVTLAMSIDPAAQHQLTRASSKESSDGESDSDNSVDEEEGLTLAAIAAMSQKKTPKETSHFDNVNPACDQSTATPRTDHCDEENTMKPAAASLPGDVCLICGSTFDRTNGLKGRLNHIKRCSKKHGFSGRDTVVDDHEDFVQSSKPPSVGVQDNNPYSKQRAVWHGDAGIDLTLAAHEAFDYGETAHVEGSMNVAEPAQTIQTTLKNFFEAPVRSLNNVLLLGARRVAKAGEIVTSKKTQGRGGWGGGTKTRDFFNSPAYKRITGTDFNVDGFMYARSSLTKNYWLTHFHSDHYGGITKDWNHGTIFCSLPTANLVNQQLGVDKKWLHPIPMNTATVIESNGRPISVTLLDANHCPGAVMFLFEVGKRRILHVGDFRWNTETMLKQAPLKYLHTNNIRLDELYLDTTYCDERYSLPTQNEAIHACVNVAIQETTRPGKTLFLFGAYTIGKERIYLSVAERLGMRVFVDKNRMKILQALDWPKERLMLLTTNREDTCLWVVPLGHINFKNMGRYVGGSSKVFSTRVFDRVVGFRPTGWTHSPGGGLVSTRTSGAFTVHGVAYSEHSSFPELVECLDILRPKKIVPTVSVSKSQEQIDLLLSALRNRRERQNTL